MKDIYPRALYTTISKTSSLIQSHLEVLLLCDLSMRIFLNVNKRDIPTTFFLVYMQNDKISGMLFSKNMHIRSGFLLEFNNFVFSKTNKIKSDEEKQLDGKWQ